MDTNNIQTHEDYIAEIYGFDDVSNNSVLNTPPKKYNSLNEYNFEQFMKDDKFIPLHESDIVAITGYCYTKDHNGDPAEFLFSYSPSKSYEDLIKDDSIQYIYNRDDCYFRIKTEKLNLDMSIEKLRNIKTEKKLYESIESKIIEMPGNNKSSLSLFKRLFNKNIEEKNTNDIDKVLEKFGFENLADYKEKSKLFFSTVDEKIEIQYAHVQNIQDKIKCLYKQSEVLRNRIYDVVHSNYGNYPLIHEVDGCALESIYDVNEHYKRVLSIKELSELEAHYDEEYFAKETAIDLINGDIPYKGKPIIHDISIDR